MSLFREDTKLQGLKGKDLRKLDLARYNVVVEDADTILLEEKGLLGFFKSPLAIRLAGIDAPEIAKHSIWDYKKALVLGYMGLEEDQPHAQEAKEWLEQRIKNSKGLVAYTAPDQQTYGRSVGVLADEYSNINLQLLQYGQATALPYGPKDQDVLSRSMAAKQEAFARENTLGLWNYKRYQVQHELLGSSLTHNVLMRADRGDGSYAGYRKSQLDALGNEQLDSRFSARDDNYNTIEGLGHQGIAHYFRRAMTPFGSGFRPGAEMPPALKGLHGLSDYVVFDLETSGLDKAKDQALEIAGIKYRAGQEVERFHSFVRPDIEISPGAQKIHKLSARLLNRVGQSREEAYSAFSKFAGDLPLVGHNIEDFDVPFLNADLERLGLSKLTNPTVDTLRAAKGALPDAGGYKLESLTKELGLPPRRAHRAMEDVLAVGDLIPKLKSSSAFASAAEQTTKKAMSPLLRKGLLIGGGLALAGAAIYGIRAISGNPADYNSIEGLSSGPYAQQSKRTTGVDFRSPYDALRRWITSMGKNADELLGNAKFKGMLSKALGSVGGASGIEGGELLGAGSFGAAYRMKANVEWEGNSLSLPFVRKKVIKDDERFTSALQDEALTLEDLSSYAGKKNIPSYYNYDMDRDFMDIENIPGKSLRDFRNDDGVLTGITEEERTNYIFRASHIAKELHKETGYAHGDVFPRNIMIHEQTREPILIDFSVARKTRKASEVLQRSLGGSTPIPEGSPVKPAQIVLGKPMAEKKMTELTVPQANNKVGAKGMSLKQKLATAEPLRTQGIMAHNAIQHNRLPGAVNQPPGLCTLSDPANRR